MSRVIVMIGAMLISWCVLANTWTDPETGIEWTYREIDGCVSVGGGEYSKPAVPIDISGELSIPACIFKVTVEMK